MISVNQLYDTFISKFPDVFVTKYYTRINEALPCIYVRESHSPLKYATNIDFSDKQMRFYFYVEVFGEETEGLVDRIETAMREMGFLEELSEMIPNYDPSIERVSMRFSRVICDGDTILEIEGDTEGENP